MMRKLSTWVQNHKLAVTSGGAAFMTVASAVPALAADGDSASVSTLLGVFSDLAAWTWKEVGLLLTFILSQPILMISMGIFFVGLIIAMFIRIYHSV